jgi:hypothetical protein
LVFSDGGIESIIIESVPVTHFNVSGSGIEVPVGASIAHHESLEVGLEVPCLSS